MRTNREAGPEVRWRAGLWSALIFRAFLFLLGMGSSVAGVAEDTTAPSRVAPPQILVDGRTRSWSGGRLLLAPGAHRLQFRYGPSEAAREQPLRWRCRLAGLDEDWQEAAGEMRVTVMFFTPAEELVGNEDFMVRGESAGWRGSLGASGFRHRQATVTVPPQATRMRVVLASGGSRETLGLIAFRGLKVVRGGAADANRENLWPHQDFSPGPGLDPMAGKPDGWQRGGYPLHLAQVVAPSPSPGTRALAVLDDSRTGYAEWSSDFAFAGRWQAGEVLTLEWEELFSVGLGGSQGVDYNYVPPGDYVFRVQALDPFGKELGDEIGVAIVVPKFFWETWWFLTLVVVASAGLLAWRVREVTHRRMQRKLEGLERQRAVERERARIAQDLHDDMGARLTQISLLSDLTLREGPGTETARGHIEKISRVSREVAKSLDETVWAVDPVHDTLDGLGNYLSQFASELFADTSIRCRLEVPALLPAIPLSSQVRHNLFLAAKEAVHNAIHHSEAQEVRVALAYAAPVVTITVEDNGRGFDAGKVPAGNGLGNMQRRLELIQGRCTVESRPGHGTRVILQLALTVAPGGLPQ